MKPIFFYLALASAILTALSLFLPDPGGQVLGGLAIAAGAALIVLLAQAPKTVEPKAVEASKPVVVEAKGSAEAEVIAFLGKLQEKGRLIDFLMDDIASYEDAQVGAAARVVYQGCRAVLDEHLKVEPLQTAAEGSRVTVPAGFSAAEYQLSGQLSGNAPFQGTLVHKGWKVASIKLPKVIAPSGDGVLPPLAPAQVEVR